MLRVSKDHVLFDRLARHSALSDAARARLSQIPMVARTFESGDYIVREADRPEACVILLSGFAFRQKTTGHGNRQIVAVCMPGDIVDLENLYLNTADHSVQMLTAGDVFIFQRTALQAAVTDDPSIAKAVIVQSLIDASLLREWMTNIGRRSAKQKVAHLLCEFAIRLASSKDLSIEYHLPMNQEQLGDALGLTAVHVNRMLRTLADSGVAFWTRQLITIPDIRALMLICDFSGRYLHQDQGQV